MTSLPPPAAGPRDLVAAGGGGGGRTASDAIFPDVSLFGDVAAAVGLLAFAYIHQTSSSRRHKRIVKQLLKHFQRKSLGHEVKTSNSS